MWKKVLLRGACSYCVSVALTLFISLILVLCGAPRVCTPAFVERAGGEIAAVMLQPLLLGLIAFGFGPGSVLFEIDRWSFLKQGAAHLALTAAVWIIVELICFTPITPPVVVSFTASAAFTYAVTWGVQYFVWRAQVRRLNEKIHKKNGENHERH